MSIEALFFDLDETLLDSSRFAATIAQTCEVIAAHVPELTADQLLEANSLVFATLGPDTLGDWTLGRLTGHALGLRAWRETLLRCNYDDESVVQVAEQTHRGLARASYQLYEDARQLIDVIDRSKVAVALVTNGASDTQREKLDALGILEWFAAVIISGEHGVAKPDTSVFQLAIDQLGVHRESVWHIGDSLETDVVGAQAAGLTGVWLNRKGKPPRHGVTPDFEIASLTELAGFLTA